MSDVYPDSSFYLRRGPPESDPDLAVLAVKLFVALKDAQNPAHSRTCGSCHRLLDQAAETFKRFGISTP